MYSASWTHDLGGWTPDARGWSVVGGMLTYDGHDQGMAVAPATVSVPDYAVQARIRLDGQDTGDANGFGVAIRATARPNISRAIFAGFTQNCCGGNGSYVGAVWYGAAQGDPGTPARPTLLARSSLPMNNAWHRYRVEVRGSAITLMLDGRTIVSARSSQFLSQTSVGLVSSHDEISVARFRVFRLR